MDADYISTHSADFNTIITLDSLTDDPVWVGWKFESPRPDAAPTKVPYGIDTAGTLTKAPSDNGCTWVTRPEIEAVSGTAGLSGIGLMFCELPDETFICGADLDSCISDNTIAPWAAERIELLNSYTEVSPSGTGVKVLFRLAPDDWITLSASLGGKYGAGGSWRMPGGEPGQRHGPKVELHSRLRFYTITGNRVGKTPEEIRLLPTDALLRLLESLGPLRQVDAPDRYADDPEYVVPDGGTLVIKLRTAVANDMRLAGYLKGVFTHPGDRSACAMALGAALKGSGFTYGEMVRALELCPYTNAWTAEKGHRDNRRELIRIWKNAGEYSPRENPQFDGELRPEGIEENAAFNVIRVSDWEGQPIKQIKWLVKDWLPAGFVTLLYGEGGIGKTQLLQQLLSSAALGKPWLGLDMPQCPAFGLFCEDPDYVLHQRQSKINADLGVSYRDIPNMEFVSLYGEDCFLSVTDSFSGKVSPAPLFDKLRQAVMDLKAGIIGIDVAGVVFDGNENDRRQVSTFMRMLISLARKSDAAIILNAHPKRSAATMNYGSLPHGWKSVGRFNRLECTLGMSAR